jgi:mono/diheme cytochrome c family protein
MAVGDGRSLLSLALSVLIGGLIATGAVLAARAQPGRPAGAGAPADPAGHGTPAGWRFAWPGGGDAARGRAVFVRLECYSCHEVRGEPFPAPGNGGRTGPELAAMGPLHPPEYFAEAVINPSAVIEPGRGYAAADGSSRMPSYNDTVTVQEVVDLVAYLNALRPPAAGPAGPGGGTAGSHDAHH